MQLDYLIIGQGISGTWLSYYLEKEGCSFLVIDNGDTNAPSRVAAGIINPVTGRRYSTTWMAEELWPFLLNAYQVLGDDLQINAISQKNVLDFFPSPQMRLGFLQRLEEDNSYISLPQNENDQHPVLQYEFGYGTVSPVYTAHLENILPTWRRHLQQTASIHEEVFDAKDLIIHPGKIQYRDITATKIIFCDGAAGADLPWFSPLPFAPNKGEALLLQIEGLDPSFIYKKGMMLVPLTHPGEWWIGSGYHWDFNDLLPTDEFRNKTEALLRSWLKMPYTITGHLAAGRPATLERRPFVGTHPIHPAIGILNGMGTKGCSLAPYFARQLTDHLLYNKPIHPEADVKRFTKTLSRIRP